ncbi:hypothetical protein NDU88_004087 [Pleurodeles waltl]|uniref:Uncharacterized protein n=1 Tax=Pleurodeles waltl TaxID=8319 RepID=A0AAV7T8B5_PLEWA|nr:hypothetical protein NDU88_004087 [Pleurodeles waltl]
MGTEVDLETNTAMILAAIRESTDLFEQKTEAVVINVGLLRVNFCKLSNRVPDTELTTAQLKPVLANDKDRLTRLQRDVDVLSARLENAEEHSC